MDYNAGYLLPTDDRYREHHDHIWIVLQFVYVVGLHAVQFGNNWIQKIPLTAKLDSACGLVQFLLSSEFFHPIISKLDSM